MIVTFQKPSEMCRFSRDILFHHRMVEIHTQSRILIIISCIVKFNSLRARGRRISSISNIASALETDRYVLVKIFRRQAPPVRRAGISGRPKLGKHFRLSVNTYLMLHQRPTTITREIYNARRSGSVQY